MTTTTFAIMVIFLVGLAIVSATLYGEVYVLRTALRSRQRSYDALMQRVLKAENDFSYLKDTITVLLQRPVIAQLKDEQLQEIARSIALAAMSAIPIPSGLKN